MQKTIATLMAVSLIYGFGMTTGLAEEGDPPDAANYGLCTAQDNTSHANETTNGTVHSTPPFSSLSDEDCEDASPPSGPEDTPGGDEAPDDPGSQGDDESGDNPDQDDNPGDDHGP